jgi:4-diphosphocytidyl-2-C-methyl-D-erythritol kinase
VSVQVHRSAVELVVQAPAKLNLFFEVLARRNDGYHEIETLMCPIDLYDTLFFREEPDGRVQLQCQQVSSHAGGNGAHPLELPQPRDNLAVRAVDLLRQQAGVSAGASLRLVKRIPTSAGLGGGSSDAAAALVAANEGWQLGWSPSELAELGAQLGSDVPFFLSGGAAVCRGRGEKVAPMEEAVGLHFVVVRPAEGLSTAAVYAACRPAQTPRSVDAVRRAMARGDLAEVGRLLFNRLEPAAEGLSPRIGRLKNEFARLDFLGHGMSGSGTSCFGLCRHGRHARRLARCLAAGGAGSVYQVRSCR